MSFLFNIECLGKMGVACHSEDAMTCVKSLHVAVWLRCALFSVNRRKVHSVFEFVVSNRFAQDSCEHLLSVGRTYMLLAMLSLKHARPTWQVGRANKRMILFIPIHQQVIRREVFPASRPV